MLENILIAVFAFVGYYMFVAFWSYAIWDLQRLWNNGTCLKCNEKFFLSRGTEKFDGYLVAECKNGHKLHFTYVFINHLNGFSEIHRELIKKEFEEYCDMKKKKKKKEKKQKKVINNISEDIIKDDWRQLTFVSCDAFHLNGEKYKENRIDYYMLQNGKRVSEHYHIELTEDQLKHLYAAIGNVIGEK